MNISDVGYAKRDIIPSAQLPSLVKAPAYGTQT